MQTKEYTSDLHCNSCVHKLSSFFDAEDRIEFWAVDLKSEDHTLTVEGEISAQEVVSLAQKAGFTLAPK